MLRSEAGIDPRRDSQSADESGAHAFLAEPREHIVERFRELGHREDALTVAGSMSTSPCSAPGRSASHAARSRAIDASERSGAALRS